MQNACEIITRQLAGFSIWESSDWNELLRWYSYVIGPVPFRLWVSLVLFGFKFLEEILSSVLKHDFILLQSSLIKNHLSWRYKRILINFTQEQKITTDFSTRPFDIMDENPFVPGQASIISVESTKRELSATSVLRLFSKMYIVPYVLRRKTFVPVITLLVENWHSLCCNWNLYFTFTKQKSPHRKSPHHILLFTNNPFENDRGREERIKISSVSHYSAKHEQT